MVPQRELIRPIRNGFRLMRTHIMTFSRLVAMARDGEVKQRQDLFRHLQVSCRVRIPATLIWPQRSIGSSCQTGKMAALLNASFVGV